MFTRNVCSGHVAVSLVLPATAEKPGSRPGRPRRETPFHAKVHPSSAPRFETHPGLAAPSPGNSVYILF